MTPLPLRSNSVRLRGESMNTSIRSVLFVVVLLALIAAPSLSAGTGTGQGSGKRNAKPSIQHVLLISIDGMHALDFINCVNGISGANGGLPYCPNMAALKPNGIDYLFAYTSQPSDSFPGLMALMTGGSPRSVGAFYDDAYDRDRKS